MGCAGEGNESRPPSRAELIPTPHAKQQIPRTLSPRKRGCERLGMTSPTILDSLIRSAYQYATSRLSICNVRGGFPSDCGVSRWHRRCDARVAGSCVDDTRRTPAARIRTGRPVRGSASRRGLGADWLGITPPLRLGPLGGDARDHIGSRGVGSPLRTERLSISLVLSLGRARSFYACGGRVVSI